MSVEVFFTSTLQNGALTKRFFKTPFTWSSALPIGTDVYFPSNYGKGSLKGVVINVRVMENSTRVLLGTERPTEDMRDFLIPEGCKEFSSWLD